MFLCLDGHSGELREILLEEYTVSGLSVAWGRHRFFVLEGQKSQNACAFWLLIIVLNLYSIYTLLV